MLIAIDAEVPWRPYGAGAHFDAEAARTGRTVNPNYVAIRRKTGHVPT